VQALAPFARIGANQKQGQIRGSKLNVVQALAPFAGISANPKAQNITVTP
jgi:hypothetical protein